MRLPSGHFGRDIKQASAYRRLFGSQPSLVTAPNTFGLLPDRRAPFWTFARRSGTVPWEGRQTCDGCDDRIPGTYIRRAPNRRPVHRSPEASPVRSGRCCLRGCQSLPLVQRSPADERERTRTGTAPAGPGVGAQAPVRIPVKPITRSDANRSPVPKQTDHLSERSDAGRNHESRFSVRVDGRLRFRIESPFRSSLDALCTRRSRIALASVGSPMTSCHLRLPPISRTG